MSSGLARASEWPMLPALVIIHYTMSTEIPEVSFLDFKCPYCGELNSFPSDSAGRLRACFNCMESLLVPDAGQETGGKIPLPFHTPRLSLRRLELGDWKDLVEFRFDSEDEAMHWLEKERQQKLTALEETFSLGVQVRDGGKLIGCLGLKFTDHEFVQAEISVNGNPDPKFAEFATESLRGLLGFCFSGLKLHRVIAHCESADAQRRRLYEAAGLRCEGEFLKSYCINGEWHSAVQFAMLEEEFLAKRDSAGAAAPR